MNILVACEISQEVTKAFRAVGHNAFSCDLRECTGGHPEWHLKADVTFIIESVGTPFLLSDGSTVFIDRWDMVIAHPPCTHLASSGARYFQEKRADGRQKEAIDFFLYFTKLDHIPMVCIENPIGIMSREYRKPDQYIQPYEYGHDASKKTCLWLKGLPKLVPKPECYIPPRYVNCKPRWGNQTDSGQNKLGPSENRSDIRACTYTGWARAMAGAWGK